LRGKRAHKEVFKIGTAAHDAKCLFVLRHGTLSQNFAGGDEVEGELLHEFTGALDHARMAIYAGVHGAAKTVRGMVEEGEDVVGEIEDVKFYFELLRGAFGVAVIEEGRGEDNAFDVDARGTKDADREHGIEAARKKDDGFHP